MNNSAPNVTPPAPLDYGQAPPRRRKIIRRTFVAMCLIGVSLAAWRWGPVVWRQTQILYWQGQCMNYVAGMDEVVYDNSTIARPKCWEELTRLTGINVPNAPFNMPPPGKGFPPPGPIVFLGELCTPAGEPRLVVVEFVPVVAMMRTERDEGQMGFMIQHFAFDAVLIEPGTLWRTPRRVGGVSSIPSRDIQMRSLAPVVAYAGQRDSSDRSRFTFRYSIGDVTFTAEGKVDSQNTFSVSPQTPEAGNKKP